MHEMSIALNITGIVNREMKKHDCRKLKSLSVRIGKLTALEPDALRFCFSAITDGTGLEGAELHIEEIPVRGKCEKCFSEFELDLYFLTRCPQCGGKASGIISGKELDVVSMEAE